MDQKSFDSKENITRICLFIVLLVFFLLISILFGTFHVIVFVLLLGCSYNLTDYYVKKIQSPERSVTCWPNLLVLFNPYQDLNEEIRRKQNARSEYIQKNPWIHLMISKRIDTAIDEFACLCLRDFIYPWLSTITREESLVYETKQIVRYLSATIIRRIQNVNMSGFIHDRLLPLLFQTCDRYIQTQKKNPSLSEADFLRSMYGDDLHIAMFNRQSELKYLKRLITDLMTIITPKFISQCQGSRHFLRELFVSQVLISSIDNICHPTTINRLFHLYFTTALQRWQLTDEQIRLSKPDLVEILAHFCAMNGTLHKNQLSLDLTDVMYEKELMNQFSRVLDRHGSLGLLSIYLSLSDILNDIPLASDILVRKKIYQRLKRIEGRYLNPENPDVYLIISNPYDPNDTLIDNIKRLINEDLHLSIEENRPLDIQNTFQLLSQFHCKIYELVAEKYQHCFLKSDEHFLYVCGKRMDSTDYRLSDGNFDEIALDFVHIEEIRNPSTPSLKFSPSKHYTTTSYQELEEKEENHLKCPEDTASISSASSLDERDLSTWRIHVDHVEEFKESETSNAKYAAFIIHVQINENQDFIDIARPRRIVARRYQDFYLLEQKLTEFHGIFSDARLPPRKSVSATRSLEFLESIKGDFGHFLRHLLSKPPLRNSELLYNFLTQPDDFTLPNGEIILSKMFKVVPRRLRIEKGQYLEPFLISLLNYAEPSKPRATQPIPTFDDIIEAKLANSDYGNNANIIEPTFEPASDEFSSPAPGELDSTYDHLICIVKQFFSASPLVVHLLDLCRVPLKNTVDTFFSHFIENRVDDILNDEDNIITVIQSLQDILFPNDAKNKDVLTKPTDSVGFDDVIVAANAFLPNTIKTIFGPTNVMNGLRLFLQHFQNPLLNKQLFYIMLEELLSELCPELRETNDTSRHNTTSSVS